MQKELDVATELAIKAGGLLLEHYDLTAAVKWGGRGEPVTDADRLASDFLLKGLRSHFPDDGMISEEEPDDLERYRKSRVWIIDPMDGTREFIEHRGEFAVMIGMALEGAPVVGVVYHPIAGKLYRAAHNCGAFLQERDTVTALRVSRVAELRRMTIALSRSHHAPEIDAVCRRLMITKTIRSGSIGLKVGLICAGLADLYLDMSGRTAQWDTCAPAVLLQEAGGRITDFRGMPLCYNTNDLRHLSGLIASNGVMHDRVVEAVSYA